MMFSSLRLVLMSVFLFFFINFSLSLLLLSLLLLLLMLLLVLLMWLMLLLPSSNGQRWAGRCWCYSSRRPSPSCRSSSTTSAASSTCSASTASSRCAFVSIPFFFFFFLSFFFGDQVSMRSITVSPHLQKKEPRKKKGSSKRDDPWEKSIKIEGNGEIVLEIEIHREIDVKKSKFIEKC